jgi:hypothetical protein
MTLPKLHGIEVYMDRQHLPTPHGYHVRNGNLKVSATFNYNAILCSGGL